MSPQADALITKAREQGWSASKSEIEAQRVKHGYYVKHGERLFIVSFGGRGDRACSEQYPVLLGDCPWAIRHRPRCAWHP